VVAVVCDNVVIHRSKLVKRWRAAHPRLLVFHAARYSPHDNPVERIWGALKAWLPDGYMQPMSRPRQPWWRPPNCQSWISTLAYSPACT
jgi:hypothetical protein